MLVLSRFDLDRLLSGIITLGVTIFCKNIIEHFEPSRRMKHKLTIFHLMEFHFEIVITFDPVGTSGIILPIKSFHLDKIVPFVVPDFPSMHIWGGGNQIRLFLLGR